MTTPAVELVVVPDLVGLLLAHAVEQLDAAGLGFELVGGEVPAHAVVGSQDPLPGSPLEVGETVRIVMRRTTSLYEDLLPQVLRSDARFVAFLRGFEDVGASLYDAPASFDQTFDPTLGSPEIVRWMLGWIGVTADGALPDDRIRALASAAMATFASRGTAASLHAILTAATGGGCEIVDPGGIDRGVVLRPGAEYDEPEPPVELRVELIVLLETLGSVRFDRLAELIDSMVPAWLPYSIVVDDAQATGDGDA